MNLGIVLIFAAALPPAPVPTSTPDACGGARTALLAALDRPTVGYSACAVKPGDVVAELGYQQTSAPGSQSTAFPQQLFRYGAARDLEVDLSGPAPGDLSLGMKYQFASGADQAAAIDVIFSAPTGAAAFTSGVPTQTLNLDYSRSLSSTVGLGVTLGLVNAAGTALTPSAVLTQSLGERGQLSAEAFARRPLFTAGQALFGSDAGVQWLLTPAVEADVELGRTASPAGPAHYWGAGLGLRL